MILVSVLVADSSERTMPALRQAGLNIKTTIKDRPCVIAWINPPDLESLALTDGVRRVETAED